MLIPAYKSDAVVERTVRSILGQTYPQRLFDVVVISDHQSEMTNFRLAQHPITLLTPNFKNSSKSKSLQFAINNLPQFKIYDIVVVLDADNIVLPEFLEELNAAYEYAGTKAIQVHRLSKNRDTSSAILDATFEEINNSIFRLGHVAIGMPSAIAGSGMAFDFNWFKDNITKISEALDDKELDCCFVKEYISTILTIFSFLMRRPVARAISIVSAIVGFSPSSIVSSETSVISLMPSSTNSTTL